jgi:hypothetical protein
MFNTVLLVAVSLAAGQEAEPSAYEHLKDLECFIGTWEGEAVVPESSAASETVKKWAGKPVRLRMTVKWAADKSAQIVQSTFEVPGEVRISQTLLRGWDHSEKKIRTYSFTSHKGAWSGTLGRSGDTWVMKYTGFNLDGERCTGTRSFEFESKDTYSSKDTDQTVGGEPFPDVEYKFKRVGKVPPVSNYERLKGLESLVGEWEAKKTDGGTTHWTFNWTKDKNGLQNVITGTGPGGRVTFLNAGLMGWDPDNRRITNWCVNRKGKPITFLWAQLDSGNWETWLPGSTYKATVTPVDANTWRMVSGDTVEVFKRVKK